MRAPTEKAAGLAPANVHEAFKLLIHDYNAVAAKHPGLDIAPPSQAVFEAGWKAHETLRNSCQHELYSDSDSVKPSQICDRNGQVVLGLCKVCGQAEAELEPQCSGKRVLDPIDGDCLPPISTRVQIHLASRNAWVEHTVVGYYWPGMPKTMERYLARLQEPKP